MDNKSLDSRRYKRMFQLSDDPAWIEKCAEIKNEETRFEYPSIKSFLDVLVYANKVPYEDDKRQGFLGYLVAKQLFKFYKENLDLNQPAFKTYKPENNLHNVLADELYTFEASDLKGIRDGVISAIRNIGDVHIFSLSKKVDTDKLNDLIDFALTRAYIVGYWGFLFANPLVTVLLENENVSDRITISSSLTKAQLEKVAEEEDSDEQGRKGGEIPLGLDDELYTTKDKEDSKITDFTGTKIRLSQLIEAFKISRASWALKLAIEPNNAKYRASWFFADANIDYLERAFEALKNFVKTNPNNRFLKWHGQRIGDGDVFVTATGANFDTLKMMSPPSFRTFAAKVKTYIQETGETVLETPADALYIPVKHWDPEKQGNQLALFLPNYESIYGIYAFQKMENKEAYMKEMKEKALADIKLAHTYKYSHSFESRDLFAQGSSAKLWFEEVLVNIPNADTEEGKAKKREVLNKIWLKLHKSVNTMLSLSSDLEEFESYMETYRQSAVSALYSDPELKDYLSVPHRLLLSSAVNEALTVDFGYLKRVSHFAEGFSHVAKIFAADKNIETQIAAFRQRSQGEKCYNEIREAVRREIAEKDREIGVLVGDNVLRNPDLYRETLKNILVRFKQKYDKDLKTSKDTGELTDASKRAIRILVEAAVEEIYPDASSPIGQEGVTKIVDLKERGRNRYYSGYTQEQAGMLKNILTSPHFGHVIKDNEKAFEEIDSELSDEKQKDKVAKDADAAYKFLAMRNKELNGTLFPEKPDPRILRRYKENPKNNERYNIAYGNAMAETIRLWLLENMGPDENRIEKIQKLLGEQPGANTLSMALFAHLGKYMAMGLAPSIEKTILARFPAGGKARGVFESPDDLFVYDEESSKLGALVGYNYDQIDQHKKNIAALQAKALSMEQFSEDGGRAAFVEAKNEAQNEIEIFLAEQMKELIKTVRTRKTRYETVEEAQRKPRVALSTNSFGGYIQQLFYSKSPYLKQMLEDPKAFKVWFKVSCAASFGDRIGQRVKGTLSSLWSGPDAKYKSIEEVMEEVGAFADPVWAISPITKALGSREIQKRKSGYTSDIPDTAEDHFWRAAYNRDSLESDLVIESMKAYFNKRADTISRSFRGTDPARVEKYLIHRFKANQGASRSSNPTNNPFGGMTVQRMSEILTNAGITTESLELYLSEVKEQVDTAKKLKIQHVDSALIEDDDEKQILERQNLAKRLEDATQYTIDGRATTSDWILDNCSKIGLSDEEKKLLADLVRQIKSGLRQMIGTDPAKHLKIYGDLDSWKEAVEGVMASTGSQYDLVKGIIKAQMDKVYQMASLRDSLIKEYEEKILKKDDVEDEDENDSEKDVPPSSAEQIIKDFKDKKEKSSDESEKNKKPTVMRRDKKKVEDVKDSDIVDITDDLAVEVTDDLIETVDGVDITKAIDDADNLPIPGLMSMATAIQRRAKELEREFSEYARYEGVKELDLQVEDIAEFGTIPDYIPENEARTTRHNIESFVFFLKSLRPKDVKNKAAMARIPSMNKEISLLTAKELVGRFGSYGYPKYLSDFREDFGVIKLATKTLSLGLRLKQAIEAENDTYVFSV
jgi:hypothetical protein